MLNLTILPKELHSLEKDFTRPNNNAKTKDKEFSRVLEKEKNKTENKIREDGKGITPSRRESIKTSNLEKEEIQDDLLLESAIDETTYFVNFINGLAFNLDSLFQDYDIVELEDLEMLIEQLSNRLMEIGKQENTIVSVEDYEKIMELINMMDDLVLSTRNESIIKDELVSDKLTEIESKLDSLKDMVEEIGFKFQLEKKQLDEPQLEIEDPSNTAIPKESDMGKIHLEDFEMDDETRLTKGEIEAEVAVADIDEPIDDDVELNFPYQIESKDSTRAIPDVDIEEFESVDKKQVFDQIIEKARLIVDENKQEISIKLKPDILGELILKMEMEDKGIVAKILVDNYRTKELIETNLFLLKEEMKENGLEIKTFEVFVGSNEDFQRENQGEFFFNRQPSKIRARKNGLNEFQAYEDSVVQRVQEDYHEGQLNLLA